MWWIRLLESTLNEHWECSVLVCVREKQICLPLDLIQCIRVTLPPLPHVMSLSERASLPGSPVPKGLLILSLPNNTVSAAYLLSTLTSMGYHYNQCCWGSGLHSWLALTNVNIKMSTKHISLGDWSECCHQYCCTCYCYLYFIVCFSALRGVNFCVVKKGSAQLWFSAGNQKSWMWTYLFVLCFISFHLYIGPTLFCSRFKNSLM